MKFCAVVVTYYPDVEETAQNILRYIDHIDHLIIWENTPPQERENYRIRLPRYADRISYMGTDRNVGIAHALNRAVEWADRNGCTHLMTMDQDSTWENFPLYKERIATCGESDVAIFAPRICDRKLANSTINTENCVITSGAVSPLSVFREVGLFREDYVIDTLDDEFCYRIRKAGKIIKILPVTLWHSIGNAKKMPLLPLYTANSSPYRTFHIIRNNIWLWKEYKTTDLLPSHYLRTMISSCILRRSLYIIWGEKDKFRKLHAIARGIWSGIFSIRKGQISYMERYRPVHSRTIQSHL